MGPENWRRFNNFEIAPREEVLPIRSMYATQERVNPDFATTSSSAGELPTVVRYGGEYYVTDGHHRLTRVAEQGGQNARINLYDMDRAGRSETPLLDFNPERYARDQAEMDAILDELGDLDELIAASETPAQQVARLLREGRADEVTDDLMAQADPQEMFRLYDAGETGADMPMDEASQMARAADMGFVPGLHGTGSDFIAVDESFFGTGPDLLGAGFYTTTNPNRASRYAPRNPGGEFVEGANVMPMMVRERNPFLLEERQGDVSQQIAEGFAEDPFFSADSTSSGVNYVTDADGRRIMLDPMQPRHYAVQNIRREFGPQEVTNALSDLDYSGISGPEGLGNRVRVSFNPQDVRSRFARFDPRLSHLANLNAANIDPLTGAVAMGASQQQNTDPLANLRAYIAQYGGVLGR